MGRAKVDAFIDDFRRGMWNGLAGVEVPTRDDAMRLHYRRLPVACCRLARKRHRIGDRWIFAMLRVDRRLCLARERSDRWKGLAGAFAIWRLGLSCWWLGILRRLLPDCRCAQEKGHRAEE